MLTAGAHCSVDSRTLQLPTWAQGTGYAIPRPVRSLVLVWPAHGTHEAEAPVTMLLPALLALLLPVQLPVPGVTYMPMMPGSHGKPGLVTLGVRPRSMCTLVRESV